MNARAQTARSQVLGAIHQWDVFTFRRIVSRPADCAITRWSKFVSRTGDGHLHVLMPLGALLADAPDALIFFQLSLTGFMVERGVYFFAKNTFKRKRPANILPNFHSLITASDEFSCPSGHASAAFLIVTLLTLFYGPWFAALYLWSAAIAVSRVVLGVHFPSDILVGSSMGAIIAVLCINLSM